MLIFDKKSRNWFAFFVLLLVASTVLYVLYSRASWKNTVFPLSGPQGVTGPHGGSHIGLGYGIAGSVAILFALFLAVKKKFLRTVRFKRAHWWLQGHVWIGSLSYLLILFHAGFAWGGLLTQVLMWMFTFVIITGWLGIVLQQYLPTKMLRDVPKETIYEQIDHVVGQLKAEADQLVAAVVARRVQRAYEMEVVPAGGAVALAAPAESVEAEQLVKSFYDREIAPLLVTKFPKNSRLSVADGFLAAFRSLREAVPTSLHETVDDLKSIVDERRQLERQRKYQLVLHTWLLVHVPLSYAMTILSIIHAVYAYKYTTVG